MKDYDETIGSWCEKNEIYYTRYSDDMTFSGDFNPTIVIKKVREMSYQMGLKLNDKKIHVVDNSSRQMVTGIVVNEKVQVNLKYRKGIRKDIYYIKKYGLESHMKKCNIKVSSREYLNILYGKISYVLQIDSGNKEFIEYKKIINDLRKKD